MKKIVLIIILILVGGGIFAYVKYMQNTTVVLDGNSAGQQNGELVPTEAEKTAAKKAIIKIAKIFEDQDIAAAQKYFKEAGETGHLEKVSGDKEDAEYFMQSINDAFLKSYSDPKMLDDQNLEWTKEMKDTVPVVFVDGLFNETYNEQVCYHSVQEVDGKWYWSGTHCQSK